MKTLAFEQLCRDASLELGIDDTGALGQGFSVPFADVLFETAFRDGRDAFVLMAELGVVAAENRVSVYENLLTIQLLTWTQPGMRFGFNSERKTVVMCIEAKLGARANGAWLAALVRVIGTQAVEWRKTLIAGKVGEAESGRGMSAAALEERMAERFSERS